MSIGDEFVRRIESDRLMAAMRRAVADGDDAELRRLGFGGFGDYAQRLSELMSDSVREGHDPKAEDFAAIMEEVARPVHYAHHLVNEAGTAVQLAKDEPLGIHIKPQETDFDDDALKSTVGNAASKDDPTETAGVLADGLGYFVKKLGNDFIKANAEAHSRAGFEVKVKRSGSTKCCPWCAARIGSWAIANAPDGVFGCHENCSCTVEYTSSTGARTSARGANLHRYGTGAFVEVGYEPPHVLSREEAREKSGFDEPKRLTNSHKSGIIISEEVNGLEQAKKRDHKIYITDIAISKVTKKEIPFLSDTQNQKIYTIHQELLRTSKNINDSNEVAFLFDLNSDEKAKMLGEEHEVNIFENPIAVSMADHNSSLFLAHNHPSTQDFSYSDIGVFLMNDSFKGISVVSNSGDVHILFKTEKYDFDKAYELLSDIKSKFGDYNDEIDRAIVKDFLKQCKRCGIIQF